MISNRLYSKIYILILILYLLFLNLSGQDLKVKFYNKTGYQIDSLSFANTLIGNLPKDSSSNFINCNTFYSHSYPTGKIQNINLSDPNKYDQCGTGVEHYTIGLFEYDILLGNLGKGECLIIHYH